MNEYPLYVVYIRCAAPNDADFDYEWSRHKTKEVASVVAQKAANTTKRVTSISQYWYTGVGRNKRLIEDDGVEDIAVFVPEEKQTSTTMRIWTMGYFPWTMGGEVYRPICCTVNAVGPYTVKGNKLFVVTSPKGSTHIAEGTTGALVGESLEQATRDIETANPAVMQQQLEQAKAMIRKAERLTTEEFWSLMKV